MIVLVQQKKKNSINFSKANTKFCLSLHYNGNESYLYVNKTEIQKFKGKDNISQYNFCLGSVSKDFTKDKQSKISLDGTVYDFSIDHSSIEKEDILNIHHYIMIKNNIKQCQENIKKIMILLSFLCLLRKYLLDYQLAQLVPLEKRNVCF